MQSLRDLAERGMGAAPPDTFVQIAQCCADEATRSGDARYSTLAGMFNGLDAWWSVHGAVPTPLATAIYATMSAGLGAILDEPDPADASRSAASLREDIDRLMISQDEWERRGYVRAGV